MDSTTNDQGMLYMDLCADAPIFFLLKNDFTEVCITLRSANLVVFMKYFQVPPVFIVSVADAVYIPSGNIIIQVNKGPLVKWGGNSLLYTTQYIDSYVKVDYGANQHGGKQQICDDNSIIHLKLNCSLLHVPIGKTTQW